VTPWHLRNFLIRDPAPHTIRLTTSEGETQDILPGKRSRVKIAETIVSVGPELVECLDAQGHLLRAIRPDAEDATAASSAPEVPQVIATDPNAAMVTHFANLIHRAYQHSTELAFSKLVELVERIDARSDAIEQRLERTEAAYRKEQQARLDELYERAAEAAGAEPGKDAILQTLVGSMMQHPPRGPSAPPNGKGGAS
jgi:hypothetical protein